MSYRGEEGNTPMTSAMAELVQNVDWRQAYVYIRYAVNKNMAV